MTVLSVVASAIGVYTFVEQKMISSRPPPPMSGDLNLAVAEFSTFDDHGRRDAPAVARALADSLFRFLEPELAPLKEAGFEVQVRSPEDTGTVKGESIEQRKRDLLGLANAARADIVVAANLVARAGRTTITPELYVGDRKLQGAQELGGYHALGAVIITGDPDSNPVARRALRDDLLARARGIARFIIGLGFYNQRHFPRAAGEFEAARQDWTDDEGKRLLYLFLGNTAGKQRRLSEAQRYYTLALDVSPAYGRARLGLAELAFHRARGSCERNRVDATGLRRALKLYQAVLRSGEQSAGADLPTKVASGLGRTYVCLSQAEVASQWTEARAQLAKVIEDFDRGNQNVQELAAEAYAGLGLTYLPVGGAPSAKAQYRQAADAYQQAVRLSLDSRRQGVFLGTLAYIYSRLGDLPRACDAYDRAVKLDPDRAAEYRARRHRLRRCG